MAKTVIGLFDDVGEAQRIFEELVGQGFHRDDLSVVAHQERAAATGPAVAWAQQIVSVSGLGPVLAAGPIGDVLANTSGTPTASSLLDVLRDRGVPTDEAHAYIEGVQRGGVLVAVDTDDPHTDRAIDLMSQTMQPSHQAREVKGSAAKVSQEGTDMETIERSIDLDVPKQIAYQQWTRFEEFPQFMDGVEAVRRLDAKRLHWVANIGGSRKEWDAQITEDIPNERIAWRSEAGEFTAGMVTFQPLAADRTRATLRFNYEPKGVKEKLGDWLGLVSGRVEGDLERFKTFVETRSRGPAGQWATGGTREHAGLHTTPSAAPPREGLYRFEEYEADFRRHYGTAQTHSGKAYEYWSTAYRYGYALATDPRYRGRDWAAIEGEARHEWEARHQGSWAEFKDAVYYAWEHIRGRHGHEEEAVRIPVVEEELQVGKRQHEQGGARIYSRVTESPVEQQVSVREEHVHVERHPVDRPAHEKDLAAMQEGVTEVTETKEEPVVRKQARVVEEVVVSKDVEEHTETVRDTVRRSEVDVEPRGGEHATTTRDFAAYESDFRTHATSAFASRRQGYDYWAPAYRYGYDLAHNPRYSSRDWPALEAEARRDWEARRVGPWEEFKEAIRYGWETVRGRR